MSQWLEDLRAALDSSDVNAVLEVIALHDWASMPTENIVQAVRMLRAQPFQTPSMVLLHSYLHDLLTERLLLNRVA